MSKWFGQNDLSVGEWRWRVLLRSNRESGTHAELLALDGQYAWSWRAQMGE